MYELINNFINNTNIMFNNINLQNNKNLLEIIESIYIINIICNKIIFHLNEYKENINKLILNK
jgi:hypothetical protein